MGLEGLDESLSRTQTANPPTHGRQSDAASGASESPFHAAFEEAAVNSIMSPPKDLNHLDSDWTCLFHEILGKASLSHT